jgi:hypothetical protein
MVFASMGDENKTPRRVSRCTARFAIRSHSYSHTSQIKRDVENFVFLIPLRQQQNGFKTTTPTIFFQSKATDGRDVAKKYVTY